MEDFARCKQEADETGAVLLVVLVVAAVQVVELAVLMGVSLATVDRLVAEGMPTG
jgi:hypothetical protein